MIYAGVTTAGFHTVGMTLQLFIQSVASLHTYEVLAPGLATISFGPETSILRSQTCRTNS